MLVDVVTELGSIRLEYAGENRTVGRQPPREVRIWLVHPMHQPRVGPVMLQLCRHEIVVGRNAIRPPGRNVIQIELVVHVIRQLRLRLRLHEKPVVARGVRTADKPQAHGHWLASGGQVALGHHGQVHNARGVVAVHNCQQGAVGLDLPVETHRSEAGLVFTGHNTRGVRPSAEVRRVADAPAFKLGLGGFPHVVHVQVHRLVRSRRSRHHLVAENQGSTGQGRVNDLFEVAGTLLVVTVATSCHRLANRFPGYRRPHYRLPRRRLNCHLLSST